MPKHQQITQSKVFSVLLYVGGFLLLLEWLYPLGDISDTGNVIAFVLFAGFCFLLSLIKLTRWIAIPLKTIAAVVILDGLFLQATITTSAWFQEFYLQLQYNIQLIQQPVFTAFTPFFRTMLFLVLLWLISYLLYYWLVVINRVFLFVLFTFIYITILDTFTTYQANGAIIRALVISLFVLAVSSYLNQMKRESIRPVFGKWFVSSLLPVLLLLPILTAVGFAAPKFEPKWPDPVPFLTSTANYAGFGEGGSDVTKKVGYGEDDSQLGGSFIQDNTTVFIAESPRQHYWRIESKDEYTGKGWERSTELDYQPQANGEIDLNLFTSEVETNELEATISYTSGANFTRAVYPYGTRTITSSDPVDYLLDQETGIIETEHADLQQMNGNYQIQYDYPSFSITQLKENNHNDPTEITDRYLQLPNSLPDRVIELAENITAEDNNRYDKTKSIERYFGASGFEYKTEDVAVPGRGQDYVDQFLFETQVGYCDNFSTSMVVMLRALDIPTRWVKGFTGGQLDDSVVQPGEIKTYEVTNGNAHSWVEVYFPEVGWVPFEPTVGFSNSVNFYQETSGEQTDTSTEEETMNEEEQQQEEQQPEEQEKQEEAEQNAASAQGNSEFTIPLWLILGMLVVLVGAAVTLYLTRYKWMTKWMLHRYDNFASMQDFECGYHYLLGKLQHDGMKKASSQTLREYATTVDKQLGTNQMTQLTEIYEQILYRKETAPVQVTEAHRLWKDMLNKRLS